MNLVEIIKIIATPAFFIGAITFLSKIIIEKIADSRVEKFKSGLELELEKYKAQLSLEAKEHEIKFSILHEERAQIIKIIHSDLLELFNSLQILTSVFQGTDWSINDQAEQKVVESINRFKNRLVPNKIYFTLEQCNKFDKIIQDAHLVLIEMKKTKLKDRQNEKLGRRGEDVPMEKIVEVLDKWSELDDQVKIQISSLINDLENDFRKLIGVV